MITSLQNNRVKDWAKLHKRKYREEAKMFLIEEEHMIQEAIKAELVECLIVLDGVESIFDYDGELEYVSQQVMDKISRNQSSVSYIAECSMFENKVESDNILLLDEIQDPGNLGTLLRSALSFGFNKVILGRGCVDLYNEKTLRSTQGAIFKLEVVDEDLHTYIPLIKEEGYMIYGTSLSESNYLNDIVPSNKNAIVLGNEGQGVKDSILELCDDRLKIEMKDFDSLNVGVAGSLCMYHFMVNQ